MTTLGSMVRAARARKGWSLGALAERLHASPSHLCRVELCQTQPSERFVAKLVKALGLDEVLVQAAWLEEARKRLRRALKEAA